MATNGYFNTDTVGSFYFTFSWKRTGYSSVDNEHYVYYELIAHNTPGKFRTVYLKNLYVAGKQVFYKTGANGANGVQYVDGDVVTSGNITIGSSNSAGDGSFNASFEAGVGNWPSANCSGSGSWNLDRIPRYATSVQSLKSKTSSSISMDWSSDSTIDYIWYSTNNGSSWTGINVTDGTSGSYTISGLSANTSYNIKTRVRRKDSQLTTDSSALSIKTYAKTIPTISLSSKTVNSITVSSGCNVSVSSTRYILRHYDGNWGSWQTSPTFTGLSPNSTYVIQVEKRGKDSGEAGYAEITVTTYDIAKLTSYPNFNLGDNVTIKFSNPSGTAAQVGIYDTQGKDNYASYRNVSGTSYTFEFTDDELDRMYKAMDSNGILNANVYVNILSNTYRDHKQIAITLKGNQKTGHVNINGNYKRTKRWIKINGTWKRCIRWIKINGTWKRCI